MAELAHGTQPEFWRPPTPRVEDEMAVEEPVASMAEACPRCGTEFLFGARFCHSCGGRRPEAITPRTQADAAIVAHLWEQTVHFIQAAMSGFSSRHWNGPPWLHYFTFHDIKNRLGLSTASFIAFLVGLGCIAGALLVGLFNAKNLVDWQAIQFYRAEWLLAATAAFVAAILFKKESPRNND